MQNLDKNRSFIAVKIAVLTVSDSRSLENEQKTYNNSQQPGSTTTGTDLPGEGFSRE